MHDDLQPRRLDNLIKGVLFGNIGDDDYLQALPLVLVCIANELCLFL